jgi:hypothetical protein
MLTRDQFKEVMLELIELGKIEREVDAAMKKLSPDFMGFSFEKPMNIILKTLKYAMKDNTDSDWISYWIYELDYGKKAKARTVTGKNGRNIPIKTIDDLYNILVRK